MSDFCKNCNHDSSYHTTAVCQCLVDIWFVEICQLTLCIFKSQSVLSKSTGLLYGSTASCRSIQCCIYVGGIPIISLFFPLQITKFPCKVKELPILPVFSRPVYHYCWMYFLKVFLNWKFMSVSCERHDLDNKHGNHELNPWLVM